MNVCILIGNTDNKLTQQEWSRFVEAMQEAIKQHAFCTHFCGASEGWRPWQNMCWVVQILDGEDFRTAFQKDVTAVRQRFHQESACWIDCTTSFI